MKDLLSLADFAVKRSQKMKADESEAYISSGKEIRVVIEGKQIKSVEVQERTGLGMRAIKNKGLGFASTNQLERKKIEEVVADSLSLARQAIPDQFDCFPGPVDVLKVELLYDKEAENFSLDRALEYANQMLQTALEFDSRILIDKGLFIFTNHQRAIVNSLGVKGAEKETLFEYLISGSAREGEEITSSFYGKEAVRFTNQIDVEKVAKVFAQRAIKSLGARPGESFLGRVIFSPQAVTGLLLPIISSVLAESVQSGISPLKGRLGEEIAVKSLTIEDNGLIPGGIGSGSFDREGVPPQPLYIIRNGILSSYLYNTHTAKKEGRKSTGHASGGSRSTPAINLTNLFVQPGDKPYEELIRETKKGIFVTFLMAYPNPVSGDFSGAVGGGFQIENGEMKLINGILVSGNIYKVLKEISGISKERELVLSACPITAPYLQMENLSIVGN